VAATVLSQRRRAPQAIAADKVAIRQPREGRESRTMITGKFLDEKIVASSFGLGALSTFVRIGTTLAPWTPHIDH
jgi:hypothetical protein